MMHEEAVLCLNFSRDNELLVSGSQDGKIKVGVCARGPPPQLIHTADALLHNIRAGTDQSVDTMSFAGEHGKLEFEVGSV